MKLMHPDKFWELLHQLEFSFDPFGPINDEQLLELIETVEDCLTSFGVDDSGEELNALGMLCEDFLFWIAEQG